MLCEKGLHDHVRLLQVSYKLERVQLQERIVHSISSTFLQAKERSFILWIFGGMISFAKLQLFQAFIELDFWSTLCHIPNPFIFEKCGLLKYSLCLFPCHALGFLLMSIPKIALLSTLVPWALLISFPTFTKMKHKVLVCLSVIQFLSLEGKFHEGQELVCLSL